MGKDERKFHVIRRSPWVLTPDTRIYACPKCGKILSQSQIEAWRRSGSCDGHR